MTCTANRAILLDHAVYAPLVPRAVAGQSGTCDGARHLAAPSAFFGRLSGAVPRTRHQAGDALSVRRHAGQISETATPGGLRTVSDDPTRRSRPRGSRGGGCARESADPVGDVALPCRRNRVIRYGGARVPRSGGKLDLDIELVIELADIPQIYDYRKVDYNQVRRALSIVLGAWRRMDMERARSYAIEDALNFACRECGIKGRRHRV